MLLADYHDDTFARCVTRREFTHLYIFVKCKERCSLFYNALPLIIRNSNTVSVSTERHAIVRDRSHVSNLFRRVRERTKIWLGIKVQITLSPNHAYRTRFTLTAHQLLTFVGSSSSRRDATELKYEEFGAACVLLVAQHVQNYCHAHTGMPLIVVWRAFSTYDLACKYRAICIAARGKSAARRGHTYDCEARKGSILNLNPRGDAFCAVAGS